MTGGWVLATNFIVIPSNLQQPLVDRNSATRSLGLAILVSTVLALLVLETTSKGRKNKYINVCQLM